MNSYRDRIVEEWSRRGFKYFEECMWSSALQIVDLDKLRRFLSNNKFHNVDVSLSRPQREGVRTGWTRYYDCFGQCTVRSHETPILANSNYLRLTFAFESAQQRDESQAQRTIVANAIRLVFGVSAARELILTSHFSIETPNSGPFTDTGYASPFDNQNVNRFDEPPIEDVELSQLPAEAAILLDKAFSQPYPHERFILMWLALEVIINLTPGSRTNGEKRERYFKEELGSDLANAEVFRLFKVRNEIFKEGRFQKANIDQDCWSLYAAIQLLIIKDSSQRRAFLDGYESSLGDRPDP